MQLHKQTLSSPSDYPNSSQLLVPERQWCNGSDDAKLTTSKSRIFFQNFSGAEKLSLWRCRQNFEFKNCFFGAWDLFSKQTMAWQPAKRKRFAILKFVWWFIFLINSGAWKNLVGLSGPEIFLGNANLWSLVAFETAKSFLSVTNF